jgi:hypothetical protein
MNIQEDKLKKPQDEIMKKLREAEKNVGEADDGNTETVIKT